MRVGIVVKVMLEKQFGFIRADNFRDDIFFHFSKVERSDNPHEWESGQEVEFELNEVKRLEVGQLEAATVRKSTRPLSAILEERNLPGMYPTHHPKARRKKPRWRGDLNKEPTDEDKTIQDSIE